MRVYLLCFAVGNYFIVLIVSRVVKRCDCSSSQHPQALTLEQPCESSSRVPGTAIVQLFRVLSLVL